MVAPSVTRSSPGRVVVDASALLERLLRGQRGDAIAQAVGRSRMLSPHHVDVELLNAMRGLVRSGELSQQRAAQGAEDLLDAPLERVPVTELIPRIWAWRHNLSAYDAGYVALAQVLDCALVTADERLGRAVRGSVAVILA